MKKPFKRGMIAWCLVSTLIFGYLTASCDVDPQQWIGPLIGPTVPVATWAVGQPTTTVVPPSTYAIVQGRVADSSGHLLANVPITITVTTPNVPLAPMPVITTPQGIYQSPGLEPANYEFTVSISGYEPKTALVTLSAGQQYTLDFVLTPTNH